MVGCILVGQIFERLGSPGLFACVFAGYLTLVIRSALKGDDAQLPQASDLPAMAGCGCGMMLLLSMSMGLTTLVAAVVADSGGLDLHQWAWVAPFVLALPAGWVALSVWLTAVLGYSDNKRYNSAGTAFAIFFRPPLNLDGLTLALLGGTGGLALYVHSQTLLVIVGFLMAHLLGQYARKHWGYSLQ
jgi:hypothetical protein